ncbi:molybdate ABC transporter substrate-binding protein [Vibrio sp. MA40-2]|uniref:molybdate ABC transporter substrate-binding protein n=1 Tax=Vibrio sp. MA40-2 TaxID=3391828 RepID=UPI0039A40279
MKKMMVKLCSWMWLGLTLCTVSATVNAKDVTIAVANNFLGPMKALVVDFGSISNHNVSLSTGSTGQLYAQIVNGAPFDLFFAADTVRPHQLAKKGLASNEFVYAQGQLVLWSPTPSYINGVKQTLLKPSVKYIALPNPDLAPYGFAAMQVMEQEGILNVTKSKLIIAKGLNMAFQFADSGNANVAFLAKSQIYKNGQYIDGSYVEIDKNLYDPIKQGAVLLKHGKENTAAIELLAYLQSDRAKLIMEQYGYL